MKLSEIKGDRCFEVIADLVTPVANIAQDKEAAELFKRKKVPKGKTATEFMIERLKVSLPTLLKNHKQDFVAIMASLNDVAPEDYMKDLNMATLFRDILELLNDDEFMAFLF